MSFWADNSCFPCMFPWRCHANKSSPGYSTCRVLGCYMLNTTTQTDTTRTATKGLDVNWYSSTNEFYLAATPVMSLLFATSPLRFDNISPTQTLVHVRTKTHTQTCAPVSVQTPLQNSDIQEASAERAPFFSLSLLVEECRGGRIKEHLRSILLRSSIQNGFHITLI